MLALDHYARAFAQLPAPLQTQGRRAALDRLLALGLPGVEQEDWKYTDLAPLQALPAADLDLDASFQPRMATEADGLDALNTAFAAGGLDLVLPAGTQLADVLVAGGRGHRRHRVQLGRGVHARLRLDCDPEATFQTVFLDLELGEGSQLQLLRSQRAGASAHHLTRIRARVGRDARLDVSTLDLGGKLSRHDLHVDLLGTGAHVLQRALFVGDGEALIDNHTRFDHRAPHGTSRQFVRGLARDRARGVFNGKVVVHPGAQKTDSEQRVANLILSPKAEINAKPELEIYADDVKCAHGATFGQLDTTALFYLRSRGLPETDARALLMLAFAMAPLRQIPDPGFRDECLRHVAAHLGADLDATLESP